MRNILMLSTAASVLALGIGAQPAAALFSGGPADSQGLVYKVQQKDETGAGGRSQERAGRAGTPSGREGAGRSSGGASQDRNSDRNAGQDRSSDRNTAQDRSGDRNAAQGKGDQGARMGQSGSGARSGQRRAATNGGGERGERAGSTRSDVDINVRGRNAQRDRFDRRTRVDVDRSRQDGGRDVEVGVRGSRGAYGYNSGRTYGYTSGVGCQEILRRYHQCVGR